MVDNIGIAYAQTAGAAASGPMGLIGNLLPIVAVILIFYFLIIRPQQKREKERKAMIASIQKGDRVLTVGGMYGVVESVNGDIVVLKVSGNTKAEFTKSAIQNKVS